jgi:hypothetical protein
VSASLESNDFVSLVDMDIVLFSRKWRQEARVRSNSRRRNFGSLVGMDFGASL